MPKVIKNSDLIVSQSNNGTNSDEDISSNQQALISAAAAEIAEMNVNSEDVSIQFVEDLEEIEADNNDLYYNMNNSQVQ